MTRPLHGRTIGLLSAWASRLGGGVFEAVLAQAKLIEALGGTARVFALHDAYSDADRPRFGSVAVETFPIVGPELIGFAPRLIPALLDAPIDALHLHGIWKYPSRAGAIWARRTGRPYLISPHGMLDPWITSRGRWKKALARRGYENASWRAASAFHALTGDEAADILRETGRDTVHVIANPAPPPGPPPSLARLPHVVAIGRIHPKKNLGALVAAWRQARLPAGARLILAGWGDPADVAALEAVVAEAGPDVDFIGPVYGEDKARLLAGARFTVLPSFSEGLPMAAIEGWAAGTPAILTPACHLPEGVEAGAALACGTDPASIARALEQGLGLEPGRWLAMARAAQALATGPFSQKEIAARWADAYGAALDEPR